jgi:hypothetical protein
MPRSASGRVEQQMQAVKLIKKDKLHELQAKIQIAMNPNKWSIEAQQPVPTKNVIWAARLY